MVQKSLLEEKPVTIEIKCSDCERVLLIITGIGIIQDKKTDIVCENCKMDYAEASVNYDRKMIENILCRDCVKDVNL